MLSAFVERIFASLRHRLRLVDPRDVKQLRAELHALRTGVDRTLGDIRNKVGDVQKNVHSVQKEAERYQKRVEKTILDEARTVVKNQVRVAKRLEGVESRVAELGTKSDTLQLLVRRIDNRRGGDSLPREQLSALPRSSAGSPPSDHEWLLLDACPFCEHRDVTLVCEYNRFLVNDRSPEPGFEVYNYSLCHACGSVFATRRPRGERYRSLVTNFPESLGRVPNVDPLLNPRPLTPDDRHELRRRLSAGAMVSEHQNLGEDEWLSGMMIDRLAGARHVEMLGSLLSLERPRVLELRSKSGSILEALRRIYGADVSALPIFESQQFVLQEAHGIRADALIDFENFAIPYEGVFDLIISNHMLTHAIAPRQFLAVVRDRLAPGGHLYLYNEPDDIEFTDTSQSMFKVLNPFHMQTFDRRSLVRALAANGFSTKFVGHTDLKFFALAQKAEHVALEPMNDEERQRRMEAYGRARDFAILRLPAEIRPRFADEWDAIVARAVVSGLADIDDRGRMSLTAKTRKRATAAEPAYH